MLTPMPRSLSQPETAKPRVRPTRRKTKLVLATPRQQREAAKGLALTLRLRSAADRHDAGEAGEDVTNLSSADFIARLRR